MKSRKIKHYGWSPDLPDNRDRVFSLGLKLDHTQFPLSVDLRAKCPPVVDQGQLGSCTANAICSAFQFEQKRQSIANWQPSRLMLYYNERDMEGSVDFDSGAQLRDGIKSLVNQGVCPETTWPYDISIFDQKPPLEAYAEALDNQALQYRRLSQNINDMLGCLAQGLPFVFGFSVYDSFESDEVERTGLVPMPGTSEDVIGGHAVMAVGYSIPEKLFLIQNSYGTSFGDAGFIRMPFDYLTNPNLCDDRWVVSKVE